MKTIFNIEIILNGEKKKASVTPRGLRKFADGRNYGIYKVVESVHIENYMVYVFLHLTHYTEMFGEIGKYGKQTRYTLHGFTYEVYKMEDGIAHNCFKEIASVSVEHWEIGVSYGAVKISPEIK